jgi:hypothetical protein
MAIVGSIKRYITGKKLYKKYGNLLKVLSKSANMTVEASANVNRPGKLPKLPKMGL